MIQVISRAADIVLPRFVPLSGQCDSNYHNQEYNLNFKKTMQCATLIVVGALSGTALATTSVRSAPAVTVKFGDLDLNSVADVTVLYKRIRHAALRVCVYPSDARWLAFAREARECRAASVDRAVRLVDLPALTTIHEAKAVSAGVPARVADVR